MAPEILLAIGGMAVLAVGVWLAERRTQAVRRSIAILLCLCGIVLIAVAASRSGTSWSLRFGVLAVYSGTGGLLASTAANLFAKRRAGRILASLGTGATTGLKIVMAIAVPAGILSVIIQFFDAHRPGSFIMLIGQASLFATFGIQAVLMVRGRWSLTDHGIIGPNVFVPWPQVSACDWEGSDTLAITTKTGLRAGRTFRIPVAPEAREQAAAVLATKVAA